MLDSSKASGIVVFDLEWNQDSYRTNHRMPHEIIEIGACRLTADGVTDTFSRLIRPKLYRKLDRHIRSVTGITDAELREGGAFEDVFADFVAWCGEDAAFVTWGRDDYPVLRRNAAFYGKDVPFDPPVDAQTVFAYACLKDAHQQMNLHSALEYLNLSPDVPAHRAVYDAQCTAALLPAIEREVLAMDEASRAELDAALEKERRIAISVLRSMPTRHQYQTTALADEGLMAFACPWCGGALRFDVPWFDSGRDRYLALCVCPEHGEIMGQMHFKRAPSGLLVMHQRAFEATDEEAADVRERYRLYQLTPVKKRHHRLSMDVAAKKKTGDAPVE